MNGVEIGRTYSLPTSPVSDITVTLLAGGLILVRDEFNEVFMIEQSRINEIAQSDDRSLAPLAHEITRSLLTDRHDLCDWPWVRLPNRPQTWVRIKACPTCGTW